MTDLSVTLKIFEMYKFVRSNSYFVLKFSFEIQFRIIQNLVYLHV